MIENSGRASTRIVRRANTYKYWKQLSTGADSQQPEMSDAKAPDFNIVISNHGRFDTGDTDG